MVIQSGRMVDLLELLDAAQQWLVWPLVMLISVHFIWRICSNIKDNADRFVRRVQEALEHERERLIEDIKTDLLETLNKGKQPPAAPTPELSVVSRAVTVDKFNKEKCNTAPSYEYTRRLDRKDKSNIVNEIIYQIQSGGDSNRNCTDDDKVEHEDSAILKDVHRRNVVARMKNLFESNESTNRWHLNKVVDIISQRTSSTSMENLRTRSFAIPKASSEPPAVRLRRKIRSQQSLSESGMASSFEDVLEAERFSKRLSQYSISEYLDEQSPSPQPEAHPPDFNRVARGIKTLSTFSLSELLLDDEPDNMFAGVTLRRGVQSVTSSSSSMHTTFLRKPVDNIDQILIDENLSRCYSQYSISDLVDDEIVFLQDAPPLIKCD